MVPGGRSQTNYRKWRGRGEGGGSLDPRGGTEIDGGTYWAWGDTSQPYLLLQAMAVHNVLKWHASTREFIHKVGPSNISALHSSGSKQFKDFFCLFFIVVHIFTKFDINGYRD